MQRHNNHNAGLREIGGGLGIADSPIPSIPEIRRDTRDREMYTENSDFKQWLLNQNKDCSYCLLISADPDALASALAVRGLIRRRVGHVAIRYINEVTRPDNLAMIRYLRIPAERFVPDEASGYSHFALIDSQPGHNPLFTAYRYSLIIDHHPKSDVSNYLAEDAYCAIQPKIGATSTLITRILRSLKKRPGPLLATALLYGIRTDTAAFERSGGEADLSAYHWLSKYANMGLLRRICRSEYLRAWLPLFSRAFRSLRDCKGGGAHASLKDVSSADLLVSIADFFTKIHGLRWIAVSGAVGKNVVVIFRSDGTRDVGAMAQACFAGLGQGGGHKNLARAEFPLSQVDESMSAADFVYKKLSAYTLRPMRAADKKT